MNKIYLYGILLLLLAINTFQVQSQVKAVPDNFFISPNTRINLNVLRNDDLGACNSAPENVTVQIVSVTPTTAFSTQPSVISDNKIQVRTIANYYGRVEIKYRLTCSNDGTNDESVAYINVGDAPDFIEDVECTIDPPAFVWDMERKFSSKVRTTQFALPLVGDIYGDGKTYIVSSNWAKKSNVSSDSIYILDSELNLVHSFPTIISFRTYANHPMLLADVDGDGESEIIIYASPNGFETAPANLRYKLFAYKLDGTLLWESSHPCITYIPPTISNPYRDATPYIADVDGDGLYEIVCGERIFAAESGKLLLEIPFTVNNVATYGRGFKSLFTEYGWMSCFGDVDGDGKMELLCGNTTYKLDIKDRDNPAQNKIEILATLVGTPFAQPDGFTSMADIDGDGILDVIVTTYPSSTMARMYVWDGASPKIIASVNVPGGSSNCSPAFAGDITGTGSADIAFTSYKSFQAYSYDTSSAGNLRQLFKVPTTDSSGATTMSMFDFNNDGEMELVYRDEDSLRIINKIGENITSIPCRSGTGIEFPIVADIDGSGHAKIIVSGAIDDPGNSIIKLHVFGSATPNTWSPARRVWHQFGYNPVYVNEDLTIPRFPLYPATEIVHQDGSKTKPFNNFLVQAGKLSTEGQQMLEAPDLGFVPGKNQKLYHDVVTDSLFVTSYVTNVGAADFSGDLLVSLYLYDRTANTYLLAGNKVFTSESLNKGANKTYRFGLKDYSSITLPAQYLWYVTVNLNDKSPSAPSGPYNNQAECIYYNNMTSRISYVSGQVILCENETGLLKIEPSNTFDCYWFNPDKTPYKGQDATNKGDRKQVTKVTSNPSEYFLIDLYPKGASQIAQNKINAAPDTVFIYQASDSLIWTGKLDSDWNNFQNWSDPNDLSGEVNFSTIPRGCTNVLIPTMSITRFPNIASTSTQYDIYSDARCNNISLDFGGEILNSDSLTYNKAFVKLDLASNRWYSFAAPLRDFYTGDIYMTQANPYLDGMFAYVREFQQKSTSNHLEGYWSRTFREPDVRIKVGSGVGLWIDDWQPLGTTQNMPFIFPKDTTQFYIYDEEGKPEQGFTPYPVSRSNVHRFIYEESYTASTREISLSPSSSAAGIEILIGNPFMSHLDFNKFYAKNSGLIEDYYRVVDASGNYATYSITGASTGNPVQKNLIPPMQAFLVKPKSAFAAMSLKAHPSMTQISAGHTLRSSKQDKLEILRVSISDEKLRNRCALSYMPYTNAGTPYWASGDIYKMIGGAAYTNSGKEALNVSLLSEEGNYMDIKCISNLEGVEFALGIYGEANGYIALGFEQLWNFAPDYNVYLIDRQENKTIDLRHSSIYTFHLINAKKSFLDDRFILRFGHRDLTTISDEKESVSDLRYDVYGNNLRVYRTSQQPLGTVLIYDLQGRCIYNRPKGISSSESFQLDGGVYILRVEDKSGSSSFKVIIN